MRCSLCPGRRDQTCSVNPRPEVGVLEKRCLVPWRPPEEGFLELVVLRWALDVLDGSMIKNWPAVHEAQEMWV